ncbi:hypothetical protein AB0J80_18965 [Actinoplanes sp. NPDC049548]|uniref:hypothetical protein n=1 Tax=Actinoplanes sp. NPDC049548 TaxID=3155152 RepID=UPI003412BA6F
MTGTERLARTYRRLMWAYPRWYRQERGLELLTTLLDDTPPGRTRPGAGDVADLVRGGLVARVRLPRGSGYRVVAVLITVAAALMGAALGVRLGPYPGPPDEARAVGAALVAVPRQPHNVPGPVVHCPAMCPDTPAGDDVVSFDQQPDHTDTVAITYAFARDDAAVTVTHGQQRLAAAGWTVGPVRAQSDGFTSLDATKDGLTLSMTSADDGSVVVSVAKDFSAAAATALALGATGGLLAGWPTAVWLVQRYRRHRRRRQALVLVTGIPVLVLAGMCAAQATLLTVAIGLDGFTPKDMQIPELVLTLPALIYFPAQVVVVLVALTATALAVLPGGRRTPHALVSA